METVYGHRRGAEWTRLGRGIYLRGREPELIDRLRGWALVLPARAAFTHLTATQLRGWWQPGSVDQPVFAACRRGTTVPKRPGLQVTRRTEWPAAQIIGGVRVVSAAESLLACARDLGMLDLVQLADCALRRQDCTLQELAQVAEASRPGVRRLRALLPLLDPRSESPWESVMRVLHGAAEIPVEPQKCLYDEDGRFVARADLWLVGTRRIHEYDGLDHREREQHRKDLRRDRRLIELGVERCGYTAAELLYGGADLIRSADRVLGRSWDPERMRRWNVLIADSLLSAAGRSRILDRWR